MLRRQGLQVGSLLLERGFHLTLGAPVDARRLPLGFQLFKGGDLVLDAREAAALECRALRMADGATLPFWFVSRKRSCGDFLG